MILLLACLAGACLGPGDFAVPRALAQQPQTSSAPIFAANARYVQGVAPGYWPTPGAGLSLNLAAGTAFCNAAAVNYAGGTLTLTASATNYVYLNPAAGCVPASNTTGFQIGQIPIARVVTGASSITSVTDVRNWFAPLPCTMNSTGALSCAALGTNQNVTLAPSGTGKLSFTTAGGTIADFSGANDGTGFTYFNLFGVGTGVKPVLSFQNSTSSTYFGDIEADPTNNGLIFYGGSKATVTADLTTEIKTNFSSGNIILNPGSTTGNVFAKRFESIRFADQFTGADLGIQINAALADLPSTGGTVYLPQGTFAFTTPINITKPAHLLGLSKQATKLQYTATSGDALTVSVPVGTGGKSVVLADFYLQGPGGSATNNGIVIRDAVSFMVRNVFVDDFGQDGIQVLGDVAGLGTNTNLGTFYNVGSYRNGRYGFFLNGNDANVVTLINADAGQNVEGFRIASRWNRLVGAHADDNSTAAMRFSSAGRDNSGSVYIEGQAGNDLIFDVGSLRNRIELLNGASASVTVTNNGTDNSYLYFTPGWGWLNFPLISTISAGSSLTFRNDRDAAMTVAVQPSLATGSERSGIFAFNDRNATQQWRLEKTSVNLFNITDSVNSLTRVSLAQGGVTDLGSAGTSAVRFNRNANMGSGGVEFWSGGATPSQVASINSSGNAVVKTILPALNTVTFSATPTFDAALGNTQKITLTGNVTSSTLSNAATGQPLYFIICQDSTGSWTFTWPTNFVNAPAVSTAANSCKGAAFAFDNQGQAVHLE